MIKKEAILALGSNLLNKKSNINNAILFIKRLPKTKIIKISNFYETKPFKVPNEQENFINCCIKISTALSPYTLLGCCLGIEAALGRERPYKFASRIIDIDLIIYEGFKITSNELILPHPRAEERDFVLIPLKDLYPKNFDLKCLFKQH